MRSTPTSSEARCRTDRERRNVAGEMAGRTDWAGASGLRHHRPDVRTPQLCAARAQRGGPRQGLDRPRCHRSRLLFITAGLLLPLAPPLHRGAKGMSVLACTNCWVPGLLTGSSTKESPSPVPFKGRGDRDIGGVSVSSASLARTVLGGSVRASGGGLGVGGLALRAAEHASAVLVGALVGSDVLRALLVALAEDRFDFGDRELVVPGPRLLAPQRGDAA